MKYIAPLPALPKFLVPSTATRRAALIILGPIVAAILFAAFSVVCDYGYVFASWRRDVEFFAVFYIVSGCLLLSIILMANVKNWPWAATIFLSGLMVGLTSFSTPPFYHVKAERYFKSLRVARFMKYGREECISSALIFDARQSFALCEVFNTDPSTDAVGFDGIIYDSSDEIMLRADQRSAAWKTAVADAKIYSIIIASGIGSHTTIIPIRDHFYLVSEVVNPNHHSRR